MALKENTPNTIPEAALIGCVTPMVSWEGYLSRLSDETITEIHCLLSKTLKPNELEYLIPNLQRCFGTAVEKALICCRLKTDAEALANIKGQPNRLPVKLGVHLRNELQRLIEVLDKAQAGKKRVKLCDFYAVIQSNPPLNELVNSELEMLMECKVTDPLENAPIEAAEYLLGALKSLEQSIHHGIKTGRDEVALNCLAFSFVAYFNEATGRLPGRTYDTYRDKDTGVGLEVCRRLAAELHANLPHEYRADRPEDMAKPYRRAIKEFREMLGTSS